MDYFEDKCIVVEQQADGESFLVKEMFEDNSTSTMFAIHRPTCEGEFYMVEVEIYVQIVTTFLPTNTPYAFQYGGS